MRLFPIFFFTVHPDPLDGPDSVFFAGGSAVLQLLPHQVPVNLVFMGNFRAAAPRVGEFILIALIFFLLRRLGRRPPEEVLREDLIGNFYFYGPGPLRGNWLGLVGLHYYYLKIYG